jgi:hypothetical protein
MTTTQPVPSTPAFPAHIAEVIITSNQEVIQRDLDQREALVRWIADIDSRVARLTAENTALAAGQTPS